ncbi:MAG: Efflux transporter periplasmic adaptor subunit, partial [Chitinophagaceae bacterium]|nr:Efflux transporter periplasmic adaptor subunit [Chitinophagaceae bacterium]
MKKTFYSIFPNIFFPWQKQRILIPVRLHPFFYRMYFVIAICLLASCGSKNKSGANNSSAVTPYGVITIVPRTTVIYSDFPATIQGQQNVEIR